MRTVHHAGIAAEAAKALAVLVCSFGTRADTAQSLLFCQAPPQLLHGRGCPDSQLTSAGDFDAQVGE